MAQQTISKMETVQTAVSWFAKQIQRFEFTTIDTSDFLECRMHFSTFNELVEQAKQMEKEQIINAMLEEHMFDDSEYANRRYKYWQEVKQKL